MIRIEHDTKTGKITEIELTPAEIKKIEAERAQIAADPAPALVVLSVADKLASVGLSVADLKAALGL